MTNLQIIEQEAIAAGLFTEDQCKAFYERGFELPLHTYAGWKAIGAQVKKGEKATITTYLWKKTNKKHGTVKVKVADTDKVVEEEVEEERWIKVKSYLFTLDQVEKAV